MAINLSWCLFHESKLSDRPSVIFTTSMSRVMSGRVPPFEQWWHFIYYDIFVMSPSRVTTWPWDTVVPCLRLEWWEGAGLLLSDDGTFFALISPFPCKGKSRRRNLLTPSSFCFFFSFFVFLFSFIHPPLSALFFFVFLFASGASSYCFCFFCLFNLSFFLSQFVLSSHALLFSCFILPSTF